MTRFVGAKRSLGAVSARIPKQSSLKLARAVSDAAAVDYRSGCCEEDADMDDYCDGDDDADADDNDRAAAGPIAVGLSGAPCLWSGALAHGRQWAPLLRRHDKTTRASFGSAQNRCCRRRRRRRRGRSFQSRRRSLALDSLIAQSYSLANDRPSFSFNYSVPHFRASVVSGLPVQSC